MNNKKHWAKQLTRDNITVNKIINNQIIIVIMKKVILILAIVLGALATQSCELGHINGQGNTQQCPFGICG